VHVKDVDNVAYLLSAAHVLDPKLKDTSYVPYDDIVYQPYSLKRIGFTGSNARLVLKDKVDAGLARLDDGIQPRNYVWKLSNLDGIAPVEPPPGIPPPYGPEVAKHGIATGRTYGWIRDSIYTFGPNIQRQDRPRGPIRSD
jgi:hypothetical protein